jgi:predicted TPR repeat methyltransferase
MAANQPNLDAVKDRFDKVAGGYNKKLEVAKDFGPGQMLDAFLSYRKQHPHPKSLKAMDLGCGTGLCGKLFRPYLSSLDGVDLSENMLAVAAGLGIYDSLAASDLVAYMANCRDRYDLITISGVFMYFRDCRAVIEHCFAALNPGGILIFTADRHDGDPTPVKIGRQDIMFTYSKGYVESTLAGAGFEIVTFDEVDERLTWKDQQPVPAFLVLATRS